MASRWSKYVDAVLLLVRVGAKVAEPGSPFQSVKIGGQEGSHQYIELSLDGIHFGNKGKGPRHRALLFSMEVDHPVGMLINQWHDLPHTPAGNLHHDGDLAPWYTRSKPSKRVMPAKIFAARVLAVINTCGLWHLQEEQGQKEKCQTCPFQLSCLSQTPT
jgi:hypothetical protein